MAASLKTRFAKEVFVQSLKTLKYGSLELVCRGETLHFGDVHSDLHATIAVSDDDFFARAIMGGDIGFGESYMDGQWTSPDVSEVIRLGIRNLNVVERSHPMLSAITRWKNEWVHRRRENTVKGSRANISYHYDLGNDFYCLFLDRSMAYSCAYYLNPTDSLEEAQLQKYDRICSKLSIAPNEELLEIGTGWGGFAIHAAMNYGCKVTTTTISSRQYEYAKDWVARLGLQERIRVLKSDYRELDGSYDRIISIEMFEAVGHRYYDEFFAACDRLLAPDGKMLIQTITMNENDFATYVKGCDWIQKYIFPGGELASFTEVVRSIARATSMSMCGYEDIGIHYVQTLRAWRARFHAALPEVRKLGFDERFIRMWEYYLEYCAAAFTERHVSDVQLIFAKDRNERFSPRIDSPTDFARLTVD
jgi:cyclopropane-fatty-acyl-phospholipid synthase